MGALLGVQGLEFSLRGFRVWGFGVLGCGGLGFWGFKSRFGLGGSGLSATRV